MTLRTAPPPRSKFWASVLVLAVVGTLVLVIAAVLLAATRDGDDRRRESGDGLVAADVARNTPLAQPAPLDPGLDVVVWAAATAQRIGVPARALQAYAAAEIAQRASRPGCRLSWVTLAGIGRVESVHGRINGSRLDADGGTRPSIIGIALDGTNNTRRTPDTEGGRIDGDTTYDRAVGPLQFLPTTWARYGADGNGDGVRDPHQIDDAARGAAAYLCAAGRNMADGTGWWAGVLTYNRSTQYARLVFAAATRYAA